MNEKLNIIKTSTNVILQDLTNKNEFKPSKSSVGIRRNKSNNVIIYVFGEIKYISAFQFITIQDGETGTPVQLTLENYSELTDGINDSAGGSGGGKEEIKVFDTDAEALAYSVANPTILAVSIEL